MTLNKVFLPILISFLVLSAFSYNDDECCKLSTVRVVGTGKVTVDADLAIIYAYITQDGVTVTDAFNKAEAILTSVEHVLMQNSIPKSDISTGYISVYPKYDYSGANPVVVGYTVYISLTITIRGIDKDRTRVGDVIQGLAASGVSSISGITYDSSKSEGAKSLARKSAFRDASRKAEEYADLAGGKLGKILTIDETSSYYYPYSTNTGGLLGAQKNTTPGTGSDIELPPGKITVIVNVILIFILIV